MSKNENAKTKASEKSDFTRRCSLLSRYLREKGSFGNVDLGLFRKPDSGFGFSGKSDPQGKQNAMQKGENSKAELSTSSGGKAEVDLSESELGSSQLTIFFGGKIIVYNEFPADKAKEILEVAKQAKPVTQINLENNNNNSSMVLPDLNQPTDSAVTDHNHPTKEQQQQQNQLVERIARRASLHRFFAKRKDRAVARAPYQVNQNAGHHHQPPKPETEAGKSLEPGQSSQRPDKAVDQTMAHPKPDGVNDISMEIEEGQSSKDLELRL